MEHPKSVVAVVGIAGRGPQRDATWSICYDAGRTSEPRVDIDWVPEVHALLGASFTEWIHQPELWRRIADCSVPLQFIAAGDDIRPSWPLQQLAALVPQGSFVTVPGVPHDFWSTDPRVWTERHQSVYPEPPICPTHANRTSPVSRYLPGSCMTS